MEWLPFIVGLVTGLFVKIYYDVLKAPILDVLNVTGPFLIQIDQGYGLPLDYYAYRVKVRNKQKRALNTAALNCVAWLELYSANEIYQVSWVGSKDSVDINVGDIREVDLCAICISTGVIVAPTESGYSRHTVRPIGDNSNNIKGILRITCLNGRKIEKVIRITPSQVLQGGLC